jgi:hypothetical protein
MVKIKNNNLRPLLTIFSLSLLILGLSVATRAVQKNQENRSHAAGISVCASKGGTCTLGAYGVTSGVRCTPNKMEGRINLSYSCIAAGDVCCMPVSNNASGCTPGKVGYGKSCSKNSDCKSCFCIGKVCSKDLSNEACTSMLGTCSESSNRVSGESCMTTTGIEGQIVKNLCLNSSKSCCFPKVYLK